MSVREIPYAFSPRKTRKINDTPGLALGNFIKYVTTAVLFFVFLIAVLFIGSKYLTYVKLKKEVSILEHQVVFLEKEYQELTAKDVVLEKARKLGLHPPKKEQIVRLNRP